MTDSAIRGRRDVGASRTETSAVDGETLLDNRKDLSQNDNALSTAQAALSQLVQSGKTQSQLQVGARSEDVRHLQVALNAAGARLRIDGVYGPKTTASVRIFATAHNLFASNASLAERDGKLVTDRIAVALGAMPGDTFEAPKAEDLALASPPQVELPPQNQEVFEVDSSVQPAQPGAHLVGLKIGDRGPRVRELQTVLSSVGFSTSADGVFGKGTASGLKEFAEQHNLLSDAMPANERAGQIVGDDVAWALATEAKRPEVRAAAGRVVEEILAQEPTFVSGIEERIRRIQQQTDPKEKEAVLQQAYVDLISHIDSPNLKLSDKARADWTVVREALSAAVDSGHIGVAAKMASGDFAARRIERIDQNIGLLSEALRHDNPSIVADILKGIDEVKSMATDDTKEAELMTKVDDLDQYIQINKGELSATAMGRWEELKASVRQASHADQLKPLTDFMQASYLRQTLMQVQAEAKALGQNPNDVPLSQELTRRLVELQAKADSNSSASLTPKMLMAIVPNMRADRANDLAPHLEEEMRKGNISTAHQRAAFLAQTAHESGGYRYMRELGNRDYFSKYDFRSDLGNEGPPDGYNFRGGGWLQLTGKYNYGQFSRDYVGSDLLVREPERIAEPQYSSASAVWFWNKKGLNAPAEAGDFKLVTKRINGGYNGYEDRLNYYTRALDALAAA